jgi:hypothetical protein
MWARLVSLGLGVVSLALLFLVSAIVGLIVFLAVLLVSYLISLWEDDPYRNWIGRCVFGKYDSEIQYKSADEEIKAFQSI